MSIVVAKTVDAAAFGAFAVAFTVFQLAILASRALLGQPLSIRFSGKAADRLRRGASGCTGGSVLVGVGVGLGCAGAGLLIGGQLRPVLIAMGAGLPGLILQDSWRTVFFTELRPERAALNDVLRTCVQIPLIAAVIVAGTSSATVYILIWSASSAAAALFGMWQAQVVPSARVALTFIRDQWDISRYLLAEQVVGQGAAQGSLLLVGILGSLAAVGSLRGAMVILAPVTIIALSVNAFAIPELARRQSLSPGAYRKSAAVISLGLMVASTIWISVFLILPQTAGEAILGDSWQGARSVLLPTLLYQIGLCAGAGPSLVAYSLARTKEMFHVSLAAGALLVSATMIGVKLDAAPGAALGMGCAAVLTAPLVWWQLERILGHLSARPL